MRALIVDDNLDTRARLKVALVSVPCIKKVFLADRRTLTDEMIAENKPEIIFFSSKTFEAASEDQLARLSVQRKSRGMKIIVVLQAQAKSWDNIAQKLISGADGFVMEPYSVDDLTEACSLANETGILDDSKKVGGAVSITVNNVLKLLNDIAVNMLESGSPGPALKLLRQTAAPLKQIDDAQRARYFELIIDKFCNTPPSDRVEALRAKRKAEEERHKAEQEKAAARTAKAMENNKKKQVRVVYRS